MRFVLGSSNIKRCGVFTDIIRNVKSIADDVIVRFTEKGLHIQAMDKSHVSLLDVRISRDWFDEYGLSPSWHDEAVGFNTKMLFKVLGCRAKDQRIEWTTAGDTIDITYPRTGSSVKKDFSIPMIDLESELLEVHEVETQADFTLESKVFESLIVDLSTYGSDIAFECTEEGITLRSKGDTGEMNSTIPMDDLMEYSIDEGETISVRYSSTMLLLASQFSKSSGAVSVGLSTTQPLRIRAEIGDDTEPVVDSYIQYFIAPKVDE